MLVSVTHLKVGGCVWHEGWSVWKMCRGVKREFGSQSQTIKLGSHMFDSTTLVWPISHKLVIIWGKIHNCSILVSILFFPTKKVGKVDGIQILSEYQSST